jgi:hypothetical protein
MFAPPRAGKHPTAVLGHPEPRTAYSPAVSQRADNIIGGIATIGMILADVLLAWVLIKGLLWEIVLLYAGALPLVAYVLLLCWVRDRYEPTDRDRSDCSDRRDLRRGANQLRALLEDVGG